MSELIPGITVDNWLTGVWTAIGLTVVGTIVGAMAGIDEDDWFDYNVTRKMVQRHGQVITTDTPGFLYLEIDGLAMPILRRALDEGYMPTLKRRLDEGTHKLVGWEPDMSSQTAAMQSGILQGDNTDVPAYRWYDRERGKVVTSGIPFDAEKIEHRLSSGRGLLSDGGASRGNMFSGDASESLFTFSTLFAKGRGASPGFYMFLLSPYVVTRTITLFIIEIFIEWYDAWQQRRRNDQPRIGRRFPYIFMRGFMVSTLMELAMYTTIADALRGVPAIYSLFPGYDDLAHFAGIDRPEVFKVLRRTDAQFARLERILKSAPRPYHVIVLSDHGQSQGFTFKNKHGITLEELVKQSLESDIDVFAALDTNEAWDSINAVLSDSLNSETRTAKLVKRAFQRRMSDDGVIAVGPERNLQEQQAEKTKAEDAEMIVLASGGLGLIYFAKAKERVSLEEMQERYPGFVYALAEHPGIGFVLVNSEEYGAMVIGKKGVHYLADDTIEGEDPLAVYGPNAARHARRESSYTPVGDIVVNAAYAPQSGEICSFEDQVGHHGAMGGPQSKAFLMHPASLTLNDDEAPIIGAPGVHRVLRRWRDASQLIGD